MDKLNVKLKEDFLYISCHFIKTSEQFGLNIGLKIFIAKKYLMIFFYDLFENRMK